MIGIYKITEIDNPNNFYVGYSNNIKRRFREHRYKTYKQSHIPFDDEIKKKGIHSFTYEVLEECSVEQLLEKERYWTDKLEATKSGNIFDGGLRDLVGENNPNQKMTEDDVKIIRQAYAEHKKQKEVYE